MENRDLSKENLRKFGLTLAVALSIFGFIAYLRQKPICLYFLYGSLLFLLWAIILPKTLKLFYLAWMRFAFVLGWVNTRIILILMFYLIFTPFGLLMRLFRVDLLQTKDKKDTYWYKKEKTVFNPAYYERRF